MSIRRALLLSLLPAAALAEPPPANWQCRFCPEVGETNGAIAVGLGLVSADSFPFGNARGLEDAGPFARLGGEVLHQAADGRVASLAADALGSDAERVSLAGSEPGHFGLSLSADSLPWLGSDEPVTPFRRRGGNDLTLPAGWERGETTRSMGGLATGLAPVDVRSRRRSLGLGAHFLPAPHWTLGVTVQRDTRQGTALTAASFLTSAAQLPRELDLVTDRINARALYATPRWSAELSYDASLFRNRDDALVWENPFAGPAGASDRGRLALEPDSSAHQFAVAGHWLAHPRLALSGSLAAGRITQDATLLPATENAELAVALPRDSLDGRIDTLAGSIRALLRLRPGLRLRATISHDDRDDATPVSIWPQVLTDTVAVAARTNDPFSFRRQRLASVLEWRPGAHRIDLGVRQEALWRSDAYAGRSDERAADLVLRSQLTTGLDSKLSVSAASRRGDSRAVSPLADRESVGLGGRLAWHPRDALRIAVQVDLARNDYPGRPLGLQGSDAHRGSLQLSWQPAPRWSLAADTTLARSSHAVAGQADASANRWRGASADATRAFGLAIARHAIGGRLDLSLHWARIDARGAYAVRTGAELPTFPDLTTGARFVRVDADYRLPGLRDRVRLGAAIRYEHFERADWALDGIAPDTLAHVLGAGDATPPESAAALLVSVRYRFGN